MKLTNQERVRRSMEQLQLSQAAKERLLRLEEQMPMTRKKSYRWIAPLVAALALVLISAAAIRYFPQSPQAAPQPMQNPQLQAPPTSPAPPSDLVSTEPPTTAALPPENTEHTDAPVTQPSTPPYSEPSTPPASDPGVTHAPDVLSPTPYLDFYAPENYGAGGGFTSEETDAIPVLAYFRQEGGTDTLLFVRNDTGETYTLDISGQLTNGSYAAHIALFECPGTISLTVCAEGYVLTWLAD